MGTTKLSSLWTHHLTQATASPSMRLGYCAERRNPSGIRSRMWHRSTTPIHPWTATKDMRYPPPCWVSCHLTSPVIWWPWPLHSEQGHYVWPKRLLFQNMTGKNIFIKRFLYNLTTPPPPHYQTDKWLPTPCLSHCQSNMLRSWFSVSCDIFPRHPGIVNDKQKTCMFNIQLIHYLLKYFRLLKL